MKVTIKDLAVKSMDIGSKGVEIDVSNGGHIGDLYVTMTKLIWCKGKTAKENGVVISWDDFIAVMKSAETKRAAVGGAKKTGK